MFQDEQARLAKLRSLKILDTEPHEAFDRVTALAAKMLNAPISTVTFIDEKRQWFKSVYGIEGVSETSRDLSFCAHAILSSETMVILDATKDERFMNNPLVMGGPGIRFYAGTPLVTQDGHHVGAFCIIDTKPRASFSADEQYWLEALAAIVVDEIMLLEKSHALESATKAKTDFLAHMTHEIRTPLNAILGCIEIFGRLGTLNPKQGTILDTMKTASDNLRDLVNNFLDLSKIENSSFALVTAPFSYEKILDDVASLFHFEAEEKKLDFMFDIEKIKGVSGLGDIMRLRQILVNLISNAIKYSESGTVSVAARLEKDAQGHMFFICDVRDEGMGIAEKDHALIFRSFEQVDKSLSRNVDSTGLGLAISRKLAQAMYGDITFESVLGKGTVFTMRIPHIDVPSSGSGTSRLLAAE